MVGKSLDISLKGRGQSGGIDKYWNICAFDFAGQSLARLRRTAFIIRDFFMLVYKHYENIILYYVQKFENGARSACALMISRLI